MMDADKELLLRKWYKVQDKAGKGNWQDEG